VVLIGRKRSRVTLERRATTTDSYGAQATTWTTLHTCWASIAPLTGREFLAAQQVQSEVSHRIFINYNSTTSTLTPRDRVSQGTRRFDILSVLNVGEMDSELEIMAVERIGQP
jgi:SPP1 family predicted phage head-tail adaptor